MAWKQSPNFIDPPGRVIRRTLERKNGRPSHVVGRPAEVSTRAIESLVLGEYYTPVFYFRERVPIPFQAELQSPLHYF